MFLRLAVVAAFALLASVVARGLLLAVVVGLALTLAAQLAPILHWAEQRGTPAGGWFWQLLDWVVPSFAVFEAGNGLVRATGYAAGCVVVYLAAACVIFSRREL